MLAFFGGFGQQLKRRKHLLGLLRRVRHSLRGLTCWAFEGLGSSLKGVILAGPVEDLGSSLRGRILAGPFVECSGSSLRRPKSVIPAGPSVEDLGSTQASCLQMGKAAPPNPFKSVKLAWKQMNHVQNKTTVEVHPGEARIACVSQA